MEIWKEIDWIKGFENIYAISNLGRVKNIKTGKIRKATLLSTGYYAVSFTRTPLKSKNLKIHRLVAYAFIQNPNEYNIVNHKDGDKTNNNYKNLEWCSSSYNNYHAYANGMKAIHEKRKSAKLTKEKADYIRSEFRKGGYSLNYFAKMFGVNHKTIKSVIEYKTFKDYKE